MSKYTPGPWTYKQFSGEHGTYEINSEATYQFVAETIGGLGSTEEANARLIAAAPDLLAELRKLRRAYVNLLEGGRDRILQLGGDCDPVDVMEASDPYLRSADAAIAKATGAAK